MKYDLKALVKATGTKRKLMRFAVQIVPHSFEIQLQRIYLKPVTTYSQSVRSFILPSYSALLAKLVRDDDTDELSLQLAAGSTGMYQVVLPLSEDVTQWANRLEEWERTGWVANVEAVAKVDVSVFVTREDVVNTLNASIQNNVNLIRSVADDMRKRTETLVWQAVQNQTPRRELARQLSESLDIGKTRAMTIARDQTTKLGAALEKARQQEAGLDEYIWIKSGKVHYRPEHAARNGKKYSWDKPPYDGSPGQAINCGCHAQAYLDLGDDE